MIWMGLLTTLTKILAVGKIAVLARILSPSQFGSYGIALLTLGLLEVMTETGINIFLIQERDNIKKYLSSAWVVSILRGSLIAILIILLAPYIVSFYAVPHVLTLLYFVSAIAFVRGFINPMKVTFQKELEFKKVFFFQASLYLVDAILAVLISYLTNNESGMLIGMLIATILEVLLSFLIFKSRPKFVFNKEIFLKVIHSGKWVTGAGIFGYIFQNLDNAVVGRVMGTTSLGLYQQGYSVGTLPVTGVGDIYSRVMFPTFAKIAEDKNKLKKSFYGSVIMVFLLVTTFGLILFLFTEQIVLLFLGVKWISIVPTLKVLAILGILKSVVNSSYSLFLSLKMQKTIMLSELFGIIGMAIVIYPMVTRYGTLGAALSTIVAVFCSLPVVVIGIRKIFK